MKSQDILKGETRTKIAVANATGTIYEGKNGINGHNLNASATGIQYGASASVGNEGTIYGGVTGDVIIGTAEAKSVREIYTGNNGRYGFSLEGGAEAATIKGEAVGKVDVLGVLVADAKIGGTAASIGASAGGGGYWDTTDYSLNLRINGELALAVGLKGDVSVKLAAKPIIDFISVNNDK
ncbi:hypothetical protein JHU04_004351 [Brenneria sp. 4F2]|nr:hypothetical protein [Brenneria bubanii]